MIFSEWIRGKHLGTQDGLHQVYRDAASINGTPIPLDVIVTNCLAANTKDPDTKGSDWFSQGCGAGGCYTHIMTPNTRACNFNDGYHSDHAIIGASSNHPGGVNVSLLDGSVRFIKNGVARSVWRGLSTFAGGEILILIASDLRPGHSLCVGVDLPVFMLGLGHVGR